MKTRLRLPAMLTVLVTLAGGAAGAQQTTAAATVVTHARAYQPGELVIVTAEIPANVERVRVRAFGHEAPAFTTADHRWQAVVGIDLSVMPGKYTVAVEAPGGRVLGKASVTVLAKRFPTRQLRVAPDFVNPPPPALERINREAKELAALWTMSAPEPLWMGAFTAPVAETAASSFGSRSVFNGEARAPHGGADFPSPAGTPIHSPAGGRIVLARDLYFTGNTVVIDHGMGLFSLMAHLSSFEVREGDRVESGQILGAVGATGRVTGPHLHWAVRAADARVDPLSVLATLR